MADPIIVDEWNTLTRQTMPALAAERGWPVHLDHCFQRILLDNALGGKWREIIAAPAYRHASNAQLRRAITLGKRAIEDEESLSDMNARSLNWRR